jgi:hypothetical protein
VNGKEHKVAVIMIHGIGEQRPMNTLRSFVDAILSRPLSSKYTPRYWSKPDVFSGSFELRRLNAYLGGRHPPIDFYEFYWAHLMEGNSIGHALEWLNDLLMRRRSEVPLKLRNLWGLAWAILLAVVIGAVGLAIWQPIGLIGAIIAGLLFGLKLGFSTAARGWIGDAARYLNARPHNVGVRQTIRAAGIDLLTKLHDSGNYRRIIVVGHSLGSVIALDILYHYWTKANTRHNRPITIKQDFLKAFEAALVKGDPLTPGQIRAFQKNLWREMRTLGIPWRVTDLITLGSPLTHLPFLTRIDAPTFTANIAQRELPACPPVLDGESLSYKVRYQTDDGQIREFFAPHHAACFAVTRWTNIYFEHDGWFKGDPVGGPLAPLFGSGVQDIPVTTRHWGGRLNHLDYWRSDPRDCDSSPTALNALIAALALNEGFKPIRVPDKKVSP